MKRYVENFSAFVSNLNEELSFLPTPVDYNYRKIGKVHTYRFKIDNFVIRVIFKPSEEDENVYVREYTINSKFDKNKTDSGLKILSAITYITLRYLEEYKPFMLAIFHYPDGEAGSDNKRAKFNKLYLKNLAEKTGYKYTLKGNHGEYEDGESLNWEFSFLYHDINDVREFLDKMQ